MKRRPVIVHLSFCSLRNCSRTPSSGLDRAGLVGARAWVGAARLILPSLFGAIGFGAAAWLLVLIQCQRTWLRLHWMLDVMERANQGDRNLTIRAEGSAIVRSLRDGINQLLHRTGWRPAAG